LTRLGKKPGIGSFSCGEKTEKMSNLCATVRRRRLEAGNTAAMLTTCNEVNMQPVLDIRR